MYVGNAVCEKVDNLVGGIRNPCLLHRFGVRAEFIHEHFKTLGHERARKLDCPFHLLAVRNRHNPCDYGHDNACLTDFIEVIIQEIVIEKHLRG